jgi:uncharacterized repeat protein (TIGR03803 family)
MRCATERLSPWSTATMWHIATAALLAVITFAAKPAPAQTFTTIYSFPGGTSGAYAGSGLIVRADGYLIGGTQQGGDQSCQSPFGCGVLFSVSPEGTESVLHSFAGSVTEDGASPAGLVLDAKTALIYGTTSGGGVATDACVDGCGTVYSINAKGKETILHNFSGSPDGSLPLGNLILDPSGNLYGVTFYGGGLSGESGNGTVFEINNSATESLLYKFAPSPNGTNPNGGFVRDSAGNFYGTTTYGGTGSCNNGFAPGCGTVFEVNSSGVETILYNFTGGNDGQYPSSLIIDNAGNLYGLADYNGYGDVFKIDTSGNFSVLYNASFAAQIGSIILGPAGSFYGTASGGNSACSGGCGLVFRLSPNSSGGYTETAIHTFDGTDGTYPENLVLFHGVLYGATYEGGASNYGTLFKLVL